MYPMIRTRDFILFVVAFLFLSMAIVSTLARDSSRDDFVATGISFTDNELSLSSEGSPENSELNRTEIINRLKNKIANNTLSITPVPTSPESEESEIVPEEQGLLKKCTYPDDALSLVPLWPLSNVHVESREGARLVYLEEKVVFPDLSTSTASATPEVTLTVTPLLQLALSPVQQAESQCVPSEIVGVSNAGILLFNNDAKAYRGIGEQTHIGYARDGFPIYGVYEGEVDECGGYEHPLGYRYTVSAERPYLIGCFKALPQAFTL